MNKCRKQSIYRAIRLFKRDFFGASTSLFCLTLALTLTLKSFQHDQRLAGSLFEKGDGIDDGFCSALNSSQYN